MKLRRKENPSLSMEQMNTYEDMTILCMDPFCLHVILKLFKI